MIIEIDEQLCHPYCSPGQEAIDAQIAHWKCYLPRDIEGFLIDKFSRQKAWAKRLINSLYYDRGWGIRTISKRLGITKNQVRSIVFENVSD